MTGSRDTAVTFQTFHEAIGAKGAATIHHGSIWDLWPDLERLNDQGHGIFLMVNAGVLDPDALILPPSILDGTWVPPAVKKA